MPTRKFTKKKKKKKKKKKEGKINPFLKSKIKNDNNNQGEKGK